jgi:hypothetical protein
MFWVYESRWKTSTHIATLHRRSCHHCNDGRGRRLDRPPGRIHLGGRWIGPFLTVGEAKDRALSTRARVVKGCKVCSPFRRDP